MKCTITKEEFNRRLDELKNKKIDNITRNIDHNHTFSVEEIQDAWSHAVHKFRNK